MRFCHSFQEYLDKYGEIYDEAKDKIEKELKVIHDYYK